MMFGASPAPARPIAVYVLDFQTDLKGENSSIAASMTKAVEAAFSKRREAFNVLSRRELTELIRQNKLEKDLHAVERGDRPSAGFSNQFRTAEGFVRGEMKNEVDGVVLSIALIGLNSEVRWADEKTLSLYQWLSSEVRATEAQKLAAAAAAALLPAAEISPTITDAKNGIDLAKAGKCREAVPFLRDSSAVDSGNVDVFLQLGHCQNQEGDFSEASRSLTSGIYLNKSRSELFAERAKSFFGLKQYKRAQDDVDRALALDSQNIMAIELRGDIFMQLGQYEQAVNSYDFAYQRTPTAQLCPKLVLAYRKTGAGDTADTLEKACRQ